MSIMDVFDSGRKLRPVKQWCDSSPNLSMVPLNGEENIGEASWAWFGEDSYPVWKIAQTEVQRPSGIEHQPASTLV